MVTLMTDGSTEDGPLYNLTNFSWQLSYQSQRSYYP